MRVTLLSATLVASIVLVGGFVSAQGPQSNRASSTGTRMALIDINFIFKNHLRFKGAMDDIKEEIQGFEQHMKDERARIGQQSEKLKGLPAGSPEYRSLEEQIAGMHTNLQLETARKRKDILEREARVFFNAYQEIEEVVAAFSDRWKIDLVLRYNSARMDPTKRDSVLQGVNRAVVFQRNLNITNAILEELNRQTPRSTRNPSPQIPRRVNR